ncbi:MAG: nucleotidyltransferase domain-containing protein [Thermoplasmatota archaeon]
MHAAFRTSLAEHVANAVANEDAASTRIHLFGSSAGYECSPSSDVDILIEVDSPSAPIVRVLERINREASKEFRTLMGQPATRGPLLDIHFVTRAEIEGRVGFAAILSSLNVERLELRSMFTPAGRF